MQAVDDFMQEFLVAERELRRRFAELEKEMWARFAVPNMHPWDLAEVQKKFDDFTMVESFKEAGEQATVIATAVRVSQWVTRARYTLRQSTGAWQISCIEYACKLCENLGKVRPDCPVCHGAGWFSPYAKENG